MWIRRKEVDALLEGKKEAEAELARVKKEAEITREQYVLLSAKAFNYGMQLMEEPFIPEDLNFKETVFPDPKGGPDTRVYHRDGFSLARPVSLEDTKWRLVDPQGEKFLFDAPNLFYAIERLNFCGMEEISLEKYYESMEAFGDKLSEEIANSEN